MDIRTLKAEGYKFTIRGVELELCYDMAALDDITKLTEKLGGAAEAVDNAAFGDVIDMIHIGLKARYPDLKREEVMHMFGPKDIRTLKEAMAEALSFQVSGDEGESGFEEVPAAPGE